MTDPPPPIEINADSGLRAMVFSVNGDYLVSGGMRPLEVWRVKDGKRVARIGTTGVLSVAVSNDERWIAAGTCAAEVFVWDSKTYEQVFKHQAERSDNITGVDFSPDSGRLVSAAWIKCTATIWDFANNKQAQTLQHSTCVSAAKYSPQGDRIATASLWGPVQIWDGDDGHLLAKIQETVEPYFNTGLLWFDNHLFVLTREEIKKLDASTGSVVSKWSVNDTGQHSCIAIPKHGCFIAYSTECTITLWDTSTDFQYGLVQHPQDTYSVAFSPDDRSFAIGGKDGFISIQCLSRVICNVAAISDLTQNDNPSAHYTPSILRPREWAKTTLENHSWKDALRAAASFTISRGTIYQALCERLDTVDRITDAVECFRQMMTELGPDANLHDEHRQWALDFRQRSCEKIEHFGDAAVDARRPEDAISHFSAALSLSPRSPQGILVKRSKSFLATESWEKALDDADQVIALDPSLPWGYEMKHAALHQAGDYDNAINAYEAMLSKMDQSPDLSIQRHGDRYISPSSTRATVRKIVHKTTSRLPHELINTTDGRLYNRAQQASAFELLPIFKNLVSSMTTRIDYVRIKHEVRQYFRYVMLSHKWEDDEPSFQDVKRISVYDLDSSSTHDKLQTFCRIVRDAELIWTWSDTVCINKSDPSVLQEALVAMFEWYQGSALTIVYLRGVQSSSRLGALTKSVWNTRAWTLQEYIAAKVVLFYTEDWTVYLDLQLCNHKESQEVMSEMEQATGVSAEELTALRPGLSSIRDKLRLASTRQTTRVEDAAYSLIGIFLATGIPAIYGEGDGALGRLLANLLTRSGDTGILAWIGDSGRFNSCLPSRIAVFSAPAASHLPTPILDVEMATIIASQTSPFDLDVAQRLYDRLDELPTPRFAESRMTLPCIAFRLPRLSAPQRAGQLRVYRADTDAFGMVEIKTKHDLSWMGTLYLIHPWLGDLLEHEDAQNGEFEGEDIAPPHSPTVENEFSDEEFGDQDLNDASSLFRHASPPLPTPVQTVPMDRETRARRLVARLRQPFCALLFRLTAVDRRVVGYKRVAADGAINVQFREDFSLAKILDAVRTVDVL